MKQLITYLLLSCITYSLYAQTPANDPHWQLIFQDDFNSINTNWEVHNNQDRWAITSNDLLRKQVVFTNQTSNVRVENGNLVMQVNHENYTCPSSALNLFGCSNQQQTGLGYNYTSGWVTSNILFQYGYLEAKIKVDSKINLHPAFWTYSGSGLPYNEIDIFEMLPGSHEGNCSTDSDSSNNNSCFHDKNFMTTNIHLTPQIGKNIVLEIQNCP